MGQQGSEQAGAGDDGEEGYDGGERTRVLRRRAVAWGSPQQPQRH